MNYIKNTAITFVPDNVNEEEAITRTTHLGIAAHQDDLEIMAYHGIEECFQQDDKWFMGVVVTDGKGSARANRFSSYTDEEMMNVRHKEQIKAAIVGEYSAITLLHHPSCDVKDGHNQGIVNELKEIIEKASPRIVYTHNLADKHDTHIGVVMRVLQAIRLIPKSKRPNKIVGCEVWRDLDWLIDSSKITLDVSHRPNLAASLVGVFDSQISGGKRYDLAAIGRQLANATFSNSHHVDQSNAITYAMDLTPLIEDDSLDITTFITNHINQFREDVIHRIKSVQKN
jgi:LmbE family N-acetylglucosaminyl deacetylase